MDDPNPFDPDSPQETQPASGETAHDLPQPKRRAFLGLFDRKDRWSLSIRGWIVLTLVAIGSSALIIFQVHPFLAVTARVDAEDMVVEGWIDKYALCVAAAEFNSGRYRFVFTTGGRVEPSGPDNKAYNTASVDSGLLQKAGLPKAVIQMVPSRVRDRDRTYNAAMALRSWVQEHHPTIRKFNVVTEGVHARRTRLLYQKAFGNDFSIGVISVPNPDYPAKRWWKYSEGVKEIISEGAAYVYVRLFFHP